MSKKLIWLSVITLALIIGQPSYACPAEKNPSKSCHCNDSKKISQNLNLTHDQKAKIKAIRVQAKTQLKSSYKQLKVIRAQINDLIKAEKIDEAKLDNLINQRSKIKGAMLKSHILMRHQIYSLLTAQQKQQYQEIKNMHEHHHA
ncbi:Spy/CpxP family protein refolding chaperone [Legionella bononiensis]|uniref:Spy/CpxP family protein refolding chaperone n=1 Tax=Legionella bononiensis TaxID=2793102 RepID=A0ABS1WCJ2_9GAMM|nr:Spy/CpxP family protein refolding chaperone [Legionella bononiensis]MBL7478946.1 Spy/CpxP family protein refolding chaperone [Legionella bononiensis]MBL7527078.1 Spy/CpxP family protein refolding chaperone [Legionella bononiensis]MBL7562047.1 Spy/CpxP family protein refolding chaperone [Legionella bononiensis]